jgi:hypothetical protein
MADPIVAAPSIKNIERAIEMEASKPNPNLSVIKELVETSKIILQQSGGPLRAPTTQELVSQEVAQEPKWKQALLGASTTPVRMVQGVGGLPAPAMGPPDGGSGLALPTGRYGAPTLPPGERGTLQQVEDVKMIRGATPMTSLGGILGDVAAFGALPTRGIRMATGGRAMVGRPAQMADVSITSAGTQALTSPENREQAAIYGTLAGVMPGAGGAVQRILPQGVGGVILTGVVGFILALVMMGHRSLWAAVIAHGFFDASTFVLLAVIVWNKEWIQRMAPDLLKQLGM